MFDKPAQIRETAWRTSPELMVSLLLFSALVASSSSHLAAWLAGQPRKVNR